MSRKLEIGSNFWLTAEEMNNLHPLAERVYGLNQWEQCVMTSSGRGAIKLLFSQLPHVKKVLLPIYTCSSVINPIESLGKECHFYPITRQLEVDADHLKTMVASLRPDAIYFQSYYGFDTLASIQPYYHEFQQQGIAIVEDITHSWLCDFNTTAADYSVISLRKWLQLPDGGALLSSKHPIKADQLSGESSTIVEEFAKASERKERYFKTLDPDDKQIFRQHYIKAKDLLQEDDAPHQLSAVSLSVLATTDFDAIVRKRRENAIYLQDHLRSQCVDCFAPSLDEKATPLYFPVYVKDDRAKLQNELASHNIYCPIHWPMPKQVEPYVDVVSTYIYSHVLSLICDQRYDTDDMAAMLEIINQYC